MAGRKERNTHTDKLTMIQCTLCYIYMFDRQFVCNSRSRRKGDRKVDGTVKPRGMATYF